MISRWRSNTCGSLVSESLVVEPWRKKKYRKAHELRDAQYERDEIALTRRKRERGRRIEIAVQFFGEIEKPRFRRAFFLVILGAGFDLVGDVNVSEERQGQCHILSFDHAGNTGEGGADGKRTHPHGSHEENIRPWMWGFSLRWWPKRVITATSGV